MIEPSKLWSRVLSRTPPRYRPLVRFSGKLFSWVILLESSASILLGKALVRDVFLSIYNFSNPFLQNIFVGLYLVVENLVLLWRAILQPIIDLIDLAFGFEISTSVIELIIVTFFAIRAYFLISKRSSDFKRISSNMPITLQGDWIKRGSFSPEMRLRILSAFSEFHGSPERLASGLRNLYFVEELKDDEETSDRFKSSETKSKIDPTAVKLSDRSTPSKTTKIAKGKFTIAHNIGQRVNEVFLHEFRHNFLISALNSDGIEAFLNFPYFLDLDEKCTVPMFYELVFSHLNPEQAHIDELNSAFVAHLRNWNFFEANEHMKLLKDRELQSLPNDLFLSSLATKIKNSDTNFHFAGDEYEQVGTYGSLCKPIVRSYMVENVLKGAFMSYGRKERSLYAAISISTLIIFFLDMAIA